MPNAENLIERRVDMAERLTKLEVGQSYIAEDMKKMYSLLKEHCNTSPCDTCLHKTSLEKIKFNMKIINWVGASFVGTMIVQISRWMIKLFEHSMTLPPQ